MALHILAIDPASRNVGVARWLVGSDPWAGTWRLTGEGVGERLHDLRESLVRKLEAFRDRGAPITSVYIEDFHLSGFASRGTTAQSLTVLTQVQGVILEACAGHGVPAHRVMASTWRKTFLGAGKLAGGSKALKAAAREQCARLGIKVDSADAAEAVGILWHGRCVEDPLWAATGATRLFRRTA